METQVEMRPWERKPGEGDDAYAAFLAYRDLGPFRTLDLTRRRLYWRPGHLEPLRRWSEQWDWDYRAQAWDDQQLYERDKAAAAYRELWEGRRREAIEAGWRTCQALRTKLDGIIAPAPTPEPSPAVSAPAPEPPAGAPEDAEGRSRAVSDCLRVSRISKMIADQEWDLLQEALEPIDLTGLLSAPDDEFREFFTRHPKLGRPPKNR